MRAFGLQCEDGFEREWFHFALQGFVECGTLLAVQHGIVKEIGWGIGLVCGDQVDEGLLAHGLERVIQTALLADGGNRFAADRFAAEGARAVSGIDKTCVRQWKQFGLQRIEKQAAEISSGPAESYTKVGAAYIADEESVSGEDSVRLGIALAEIVDEKRNRFGSVAGSFEGFYAHQAKLDDGAVMEGSEAVLGLGFSTQVDCGTDTIAKFQVTGDEVCVEVREEYVLDLKVALGGKFQIDVDIALGIDDGGGMCIFVGDEVGSMSQTIQIELFEDHADLRQAIGPPGKAGLTKKLPNQDAWRNPAGGVNYAGQEQTTSAGELCANRDGAFSSHQDTSAWLLHRRPRGR